MPLRPAFLALAMLAPLLLAGCSGGEKPAAPAAPDTTEATGAIEGIVVDDEYRPLPDAEVYTNPGDLSATTGVGGVFAFGKLEPGNYVVSVLKLGYFQRNVPVPVMAGKVTEIEVVLDPVPVADPPFDEVFDFTGSLIVGTPGGAQGGYVGPPVDTMDFPLTINATKPDGTPLAAVLTMIDLETAEAPNAIDLDLFLLDSAGTSLDESTSPGPDENIERRNYLPAGAYTIRVVFWLGVAADFAVHVTVTFEQGERAEYVIKHEG